MLISDRLSPESPADLAVVEPVSLRVFAGTPYEQVISLAGGTHSVGSGPRCSVRFQGPGVRPLQCLIVHEASGVRVRRWADDTLLNGEPFDEAAFGPGDVLSVGTVDLMLATALSDELADTSAEAEAPPDCSESSESIEAEPAIVEGDPDVAAGSRDEQNEVESLLDAAAAIEAAEVVDEELEDYYLPQLKLAADVDAVESGDIDTEHEPYAAETVEAAEIEQLRESSETARGRSRKLLAALRSNREDVATLVERMDALERRLEATETWRAVAGEMQHDWPTADESTGERDSASWAEQRLESDAISSKRAASESPLAAKLTESEQQLANVQQQLVDAQATIEALERQLVEMEQERSQHAEERDNWLRDFAELESQLAEYAERIAELEAELDRLRQAAEEASKSATAGALASVEEQPAGVPTQETAADNWQTPEESTPIDTSDAAANETDDWSARAVDAPAGSDDWAESAVEEAADYGSIWSDQNAATMPILQKKAGSETSQSAAPIGWGSVGTAPADLFGDDEDSDAAAVERSELDWPNSDQAPAEQSLAAPVVPSESRQAESSADEADELPAFAQPSAMVEAETASDVAETNATTAEPEERKSHYLESMVAHLRELSLWRDDAETDAPQGEPATEPAVSDSVIEPKVSEPMADDEPAFVHEPPAAESPVEAEHTGSFIERYAHLFDEDADEPPATKLEIPEPGVQPSSQAESQTQPLGGAQAAEAAADDDEESIEQYMAKMMTRLGGISSGPSSQPAAPAQDSAMPTSAANASDAIADRPQRKIGPAPEKHSDIAALRKLANQTARHAISVHAAGKMRRDAVTRFIIAMLAGAASLYFFLLAPGWQSFEFGIAGLSLLAAIYWGRQTFGSLVLGARAGAFDSYDAEFAEVDAEDQDLPIVVEHQQV